LRDDAVLLTMPAPVATATALFAHGVGLGLAAAVPIGPVNVQIARQVLRGGFGRGFALGCGAVSVDVFYAVVAGEGVRRLAQTQALQSSLGAAGAALLAYLGVMCLRGEREAWRSDPIGATGASDTGATAAGATPGRAYATGLLMTLLNPMTLAFWFVAVPAMAGSAGAGDGAGGLPLMCAGVFVGTISWVVCFAGVLALAGRYRRNWWLAAADAAGGAAMLVFAAVALLSSLRALL
jgi:threonine/homoserine/homoserine lactone efflux protein